LAVHPRADAAAGFRAGWARLARFVRPQLREWEARWWRTARENDRLRGRLGSAQPVSSEPQTVCSLGRRYDGLRRCDRAV